MAEGRGQTLTGRILVAEDNPTNQLIVASLLRRAGHAVEVAGDGAEAVSLLLGNGADLVLMDVQMPGMDGFAAAQAIRALGDPWAHVPIVALTADTLPETREACRAAGMDDHLGKPVNPAALLAVVERWLSPSGGAEEEGRTGAPPPLDSAILDQATASLPDAERRMIIDSFLGDLDRRLLRLEALSEGGDPRRLAAEAHDLASLAGSFGGTAVMRIATRIEIACRGGEDAQALALLPGLVAEAKRLREAFR
ncbi:response regulator [Azospirillum rugosum]|uniref:CheY-like chemotaxis protein/HPt (Histidine-containing phosphotransfer) domain-containing protein n=1 Tax=Azospirillum rugosum TaxID=416170 RepID=A0ABS4SX33_9PROT|nr:response regulator [Azospirillum rugosum]MBP2296527.1 CheY-like chemotaxis protein/HPt (histidine-containing phosphotransfer) domain-containing protein [Azospirillum rugosum]MDQ0530073.1 CheY-like chemotaxis protein/HPt (histidine-containing phosphotransfer) domain-containing protein [Azospirillum rugosum]